MRSPNDAVTAARAIGGQFLENSPQGRHVRRLSVIWIFGGVVIGGNVLDWLGVLDWGPTQHRSPDWIWVNASAAMFWLALAMFAVSLYDVVSVWVHGPKQPPWKDLPDVGL